MIVRLKTPPMIFWSFMTFNEWNCLPNFEQDILVKFANDNLGRLDYSFMKFPNQIGIITIVN